jgi:hypothetical protein
MIPATSPPQCRGNPQNNTILRQCLGNSTHFQAIQRTASVSSNEF